MRIRTITGLTTAALLTFGSAAPSLASTYFNYKTPAAGKWVVQDRFEYTDGGSAQISKGGKRLTKLSAKVGKENQYESSCGTIKALSISKSLPIKRVGSYKRPVVGRLGKDGVITTISTVLKADGKRVPGKVEVTFEKDGRSAFSVRLSAGTCQLDFAIRKKK